MEGGRKGERETEGKERVGEGEWKRRERRKVSERKGE